MGGHDANYVQLVWVIASAFGAAALIALIVLYRRAHAAAELEDAERILREDE